MQIPEPVRKVHKRLKAHNYKAYLVGGCVRDQILGKVPKDWDIATSATPEQVKEIFGGVIPTGIEHGTVTVVHDGMMIEVTTFRTEGDYKDGRHPDKVEFVKEIDADLSRRDFTINAMAYDPETNEYVDPFGGKEDLKAGLIRCVRDPIERFTEDGLRCMRAVRFATVLDFRIDESTLKAIGAERLKIFWKVADERKAAEFEKILMSKHPQRGLQLLHNTGLMESWLSGVTPKDYSWFGSEPASHTPYIHRLTMLLRDRSLLTIGVAISKLKLSIKDNKRLEELITLKAPPPNCTDVELRRFMALHSFERTLDLYTLDYPYSVGEKFAPFILNPPPLKITDLALRGDQIMAVMNVKPGKVVGTMARFLLERVVEDPKLNTPESLTKLIVDNLSKI